MKPYRSTKIINVDRNAWNELRTELPNLSDSKRSVIALRAIKELGIKNKLKPELTDSKGDKFIKKLMRDFLG